MSGIGQVRHCAKACEGSQCAIRVHHGPPDAELYQIYQQAGAGTVQEILAELVGGQMSSPLQVLLQELLEPPNAP